MDRAPVDRGPWIPDDIKAEDLNPAALHELKTLPEGLAERIARYLVAADQALMAGDLAAAREFTKAAKARAGRVAVVREAAGTTAYLDGDYEAAMADLKAARRMSGSDECLPMIADCERGLGKPQKAVALVKEGLDALAARKHRDPELKVELLLVGAGARADMGQIEAGVVMLHVPELKALPAGSVRARLQYAYADLLERAGREREAAEWMAKAAESDIEDVTDARERLGLDDEDDIVFLDGE